MNIFSNFVKKKFDFVSKYCLFPKIATFQSENKIWILNLEAFLIILTLEQLYAVIPYTGAAAH